MDLEAPVIWGQEVSEIGLLRSWKSHGESSKMAPTGTAAIAERFRFSSG